MLSTRFESISTSFEPCYTESPNHIFGFAWDNFRRYFLTTFHRNSLSISWPFFRYPVSRCHCNESGIIYIIYIGCMVVYIMMMTFEHSASSNKMNCSGSRYWYHQRPDNVNWITMTCVYFLRDCQVRICHLNRQTTPCFNIRHHQMMREIELYLI